MKKLVVISIVAAMLLSIGVVATAATTDTDWTIYLKAVDPTNVGAGQIKIGTATGKTDGKDGTDSKYIANTGSQAQVVAYHPEGGTYIDSPAYYSVDQRAPLAANASTSWTLRMWVGTGYTKPTVKLVWWGSASAPTAGTINGVAYKYTLSLDPGQNYAALDGKTSWEYTPGFIGSATAPLNSIEFNVTSALKMADSTAALDGIKFTLTAAPVPEPSSMLALASGLAGMVGFGIRRRRA